MRVSPLRSDRVTIGYGEGHVVHDLSVDIEPGTITTIIGPNGCGKSTLLRALARLLKPAMGTVLLDGQIIHHLPSREVAKRLGLLHQQSVPPDGITVEDLARRGRYPHQAFLQAPSAEDNAAVDLALKHTGMSELRTAPVDQLSGGQRQRAWMAMALAQDTPLLLLDEPTTYLDIAHQLEIIELVRRLNRDDGRTIVMVLHDINEAARASDRIIAMHDGRIVREGTPDDVIEPELLHRIYGVNCDVYRHPVDGSPFCMPGSAHGPDMQTGERLSPGLTAEHLATGYGKLSISRDLDISIPAGAITAVIGPNACGKSTLLRTCARLLRPLDGNILLGEDQVHHGSHKELARKLTLLSQGAVPPSGFLVEDLVASGRRPWQGLLRQWRRVDEEAVEIALDRCHLCDLRYREVDMLSGGQRQRCWIAMALAQDTPVLLLDEPTTFLDIAAQIELLDIARALNKRQGRTIVMILHDLNLAARYADHMVAMKDGEIVAQGTPQSVLTGDLLGNVFGVDASVISDRHTGAPLVLPTRSLQTMDGQDEAARSASGIQVRPISPE